MTGFLAPLRLRLAVLFNGIVNVVSFCVAATYIFFSTNKARRQSVFKKYTGSRCQSALFCPSLIILPSCQAKLAIVTATNPPPMPLQSRYIAPGGHRNRAVDTGGNALAMPRSRLIASWLDCFCPSISLLARPFRVLVFGERARSPMPECPKRFSALITEFVFQEPPLA
jgi:hypothetical protein